jgi:dethiobiotin synthetase
MQRTFFITGTDTGAGKTVLTALLARHLRRRGVNAAAFKPLCSGGRDDARLIFAAMDGALPLDDINPWHFRAALAPALAAKREGKTVTLEQVAACLRAQRKKHEVNLIEGAGGLLSPLGKGFDSRDLIRALRATPVIVSQNQLGVVNHLLLTLSALPGNYRAKARVVLMTPARTDSSAAANAKLLGKFFPPEKIFALPWFGNTFDVAAALKNSAVRRTLRNLIG